MQGQQLDESMDLKNFLSLQNLYKAKDGFRTECVPIYRLNNSKFNI